MELIEAIQNRKSIRAFKPDPVPHSILEEIIKIATRAPSSMNTQPWELYVVGGDALKNVGRENVEKVIAGTTPGSEMGDVSYTGIYRDRQVTLAIQLFQAMGITREDKAKRSAWMQRGFRSFDSPVAIFICYDKSLPSSAVFDIGSLSQTIALVALKYGLGTCIQSQATTYPDVVRKHTGIPENKLIYICLSIGYPDDDFAANSVVTKREPIENIVKWCGI
jgi:nitroreductase